MKTNMEQLNKLSLPTTILVGCIVLGGFYYLTENSKQKSIERQQENKIADEKRIEENEYRQKYQENSQRNLCVSEAEGTATSLYKDYCTEASYCTYKEGTYLTAQYESAYTKCLQKFGLK